jgi:protein TonB
VKQIPITFLPLPAEEKSPLPLKTEEPSHRPTKTPAQVAKKSTVLSGQSKQESLEPSEKVDKNKVTEYDKNLLAKKSIEADRPLPALEDLLPPVAWPASKAEAGAREGPVRLDTREPQYISYFASIKRDIELVWDYPEPALKHGLQGKLLLEFTISENGDLERMRLIRSSGFSVLDKEAMRAVRIASPFHPIPPWIGRDRLEIIASFEYHDNRLKYGFVP